MLQHWFLILLGGMWDKPACAQDLHFLFLRLAPVWTKQNITGARYKILIGSVKVNASNSVLYNPSPRIQFSKDFETRTCYANIMFSFK